MNSDKKFHITLGIMIFLFLIIIAGALAVGLGVIELNFAKSNDNISQESVQNENEVTNFQKENEVENVKENNEVSTLSNINLLNLDSSKCLNRTTENSQYNVYGDDEFDVSVNIRNDNKIYLSIDSNSEVIGYGITVEPNKAYEIKNIDVSKISQIYVLGYGQAVEIPVAFFLMQDGTVEWLNIADALVKQEFKAEGKIDNVTDVINILNANVRFVEDITTGGGPGAMTIIGIRQDGSFYDLINLTMKK